jgi:hypothetical protein
VRLQVFLAHPYPFFDSPHPVQQQNRRIHHTVIFINKNVLNSRGRENRLEREGDDLNRIHPNNIKKGQNKTLATNSSIITLLFRPATISKVISFSLASM